MAFLRFGFGGGGGLSGPSLCPITRGLMRFCDLQVFVTVRIFPFNGQAG
jgi:hypothetical protein